MKKFNLLLLLVFSVTEISGLPADSTQSMVVTSSTESFLTEKATSFDVNKTANVPKIYQMRIKSKVSNRYANTTIVSKVKNFSNKSQEAVFAVVLPETAFISGFIMEVDGKNYTAYVKEKEEAKKTYEEAVASGVGAAHVEVSARDSNRFIVSVNLEPETKAAFYLTYEELLKRQDGRYELVVNIHPGQPVKDLSVEVVITETRRITDLKAPPIRSGNEIGNDKSELDPRADLQVINDTSAVVKFTPDLETQKQLAHLLGTDENEGLAGQFVVQYDVERDPKGGEVLIQDGYFVHFFAPSDVQPLPKHIVFILDTSYSMFGDKIVQLREAMTKILGELKKDDLFNLVEFNTNAKVWDLDNANNSVYYPSDVEDSWDVEVVDEEDVSNYTFPDVYQASSDNIKKAKDTVKQLQPNGGTNIHTALKIGLHLVDLAENDTKSNHGQQPIIVFLTDGDATVGITSAKEIINKISELNSRSIPIFALSFGDGADKDFLQKLSLRNSGFSRHIYEAADASLQLQEFYRQISSPLLSNVSFKYEPTITSLTKTEFPIYFNGSELVVAGWCGTDTLLNPAIGGHGIDGTLHFVPSTQRSVSNIERLWAYLTIKQLLDKKETTDKDEEELKKKALDLALKYSFVTPLSSLVVVKPNDTNAIDTVAAEKGRFLPYAQSLSASSDSFPLSGQYGIALKFAEDFDEPDLYGGDYVYTTVATVDVLTDIPWLKDTLSDNETLKLPSGEYKLGLDLEPKNTVQCPETPTNTTGNCTLLKSCPQAFSYLTSLDVLIKYFCSYEKEYLGVCCPT